MGLSDDNAISSVTAPLKDIFPNELYKSKYQLLFWKRRRSETTGQFLLEWPA
jgi:hypothetical protein